jgi:hypothetical protein
MVRAGNRVRRTAKRKSCFIISRPFMDCNLGNRRGVVGGNSMWEAAVEVK